MDTNHQFYLLTQNSTLNLPTSTTTTTSSSIAYGAAASSQSHMTPSVRLMQTAPNLVNSSFQYAMSPQQSFSLEPAVGSNPGYFCTDLYAVADQLHQLEYNQVPSLFPKPDALLKLPPIGVFWDIENMRVPRGKSALHIVERIRENFFRNYVEAEFICVCDISKESPIIIEELNDAQVNVIHVSGTSKNAADDKLRQAMRRYADNYGGRIPPPAILLISGDVNFASELSDLRHRKRLHVIILHDRFAHIALITCANEHYNFESALGLHHLPARSQQVSTRSDTDMAMKREGYFDMLVCGLPGYALSSRDKSNIKGRLERLSSNCGGKVVALHGTEAIVRFGTHQAALRASTRLEGEDVFGYRIWVHYPVPPSRSPQSSVMPPLPINHIPNPPPQPSTSTNLLSNSTCPQPSSNYIPVPHGMTMISTSRSTQDQDLQTQKNPPQWNMWGSPQKQNFALVNVNGTNGHKNAYGTTESGSTSSSDVNDVRINFKQENSINTGAVRSEASQLTQNPKSKRSVPDPSISHQNTQPIITTNLKRKRQLVNQNTVENRNKPSSSKQPQEGTIFSSCLSTTNTAKRDVKPKVSPAKTKSEKKKKQKAGVSESNAKPEVIRILKKSPGRCNTVFKSPEPPDSSNQKTGLQEFTLSSDISQQHQELPIASTSRIQYDHDFNQTVSGIIKLSLNGQDSIQDPIDDESSDNIPKEPKVIQIKEEQLIADSHCIKSLDSSDVSPPFPTVVENFQAQEAEVLSFQTFSERVKLILHVEALIPLDHFLPCYESGFGKLQQGNVPLEHLIRSVEGVKIVLQPNGMKVVSTENNGLESNKPQKQSTPQSMQLLGMHLKNLIPKFKNCQLPLSELPEAYKVQTGRDLNPEQYGFKSLIELLESIGETIEILGIYPNIVISLTHEVQMKRFAIDLLRVLKSQTEVKEVNEEEFEVGYAKIFRGSFKSENYGMNSLEDLIEELLPRTSIVQRIEREGKVYLSYKGHQ